MSSRPLPANLLAILACPETRQPLFVGGTVLLDKLQKLASRGELLNRAGKKVELQMDAMLVSEDSQIGYPVVGGVPFLLVEQGIAIGAL